MKVNISDLSVRPTGSLNQHQPIDNIGGRSQGTRAVELSLAEMRKHTGTGIYLMSAVLD